MGTGGFRFCFIAFSRREPASTSLQRIALPCGPQLSNHGAATATIKLRPPRFSGLYDVDIIDSDYIVCEIIVSSVNADALGTACFVRRQASRRHRKQT
jgi:hypothetical protein